MRHTLYLDHRNIRLALQGQSLRIYCEEKFERSLPLGMIGHIVCNASVSIKTSLLANLANHSIGITFFGGRFRKNVASLSGAGTLDVARRVAQYGLHKASEHRINLSIRLIQHKLLQQIRLLRCIRRHRADLRLDLTRAIQLLQQLYWRLKKAPLDSINTLRGIEGSASRVYFNALRHVFPKQVGFVKRVRRPPTDPVNAVLSLGYTLLHAELQREIESVGMDPWLGFYHEAFYGRPSLACDLIEPYRPRFDHMAWSLFSDRILTKGDFEYNGQACLFNKKGRAQFYSYYEQYRKPLRYQFRQLALGFVRELSNLGYLDQKKSDERGSEIAF